MRLAGFTLDETAEYITACLQSVGGQDELTLFPDDVLRDVHAYTQGIVGDINSLCFEALNLLANEPHDAGKTSLDPALIARAGETLNLRYDPAYWRDLEEALSPDAVHESDPGELTVEAAHLLVTSRGDVIAEVALNRPRMVLGRDQVCDISLDSSYVSRYQNLFNEVAAVQQAHLRILGGYSLDIAAGVAEAKDSGVRSFHGHSGHDQSGQSYYCSRVAKMRLGHSLSCPERRASGPQVGMRLPTCRRTTIISAPFE